MKRIARLTARVAAVVLIGQLWPGVTSAAAGSYAASNALAELTSAEQANARIELEPAGEASAGLERRLAEIGGMWNQGRSDEALAALTMLEASGLELALALSWRDPLAGEPKAGPVAIGTHTDTSHLVLDSHAGTGKLFAVAQDDDGVHPYWRVYMSDNGGASWAETAYYSASLIADSAAVIIADYLYVAYVSSAGTELRVRRCAVANGQMDTVYGYTTPLTTTGTFTETAIVSPADFSGQRLYVLAIASNHMLRYAWDDEQAGSWEEVNTAVTDAAHSLDATVFQDASPGTIGLLASYVATDGDIWVWRRSMGANSAASLGTTWLDLPEGSTVSISAWKNQALVAYLRQPPSSNRAVCVAGSYDRGVSWPGGECLVEFYDLESPAVTLRGGAGATLVAQAEVGTHDHLYMAHASAGSNTDWMEPVRASDVDVVRGTESTVERLPGGGWGVLVTSGASSQVYFDTTPLLLHDGFENGNTTAWSAAAP